MSNFSGGVEHHSQADSFTKGIEKEEGWDSRQYFIEYRFVDGKWQARMNHFTTPQQALEEEQEGKSPKWTNI